MTAEETNQKICKLVIKFRVTLIWIDCKFIIAKLFEKSDFSSESWNFTSGTKCIKLKCKRNLFLDKSAQLITRICFLPKNKKFRSEKFSFPTWINIFENDNYFEMYSNYQIQRLQCWMLINIVVISHGWVIEWLPYIF